MTPEFLAKKTAEFLKEKYKHLEEPHFYASDNPFWNAESLLLKHFKKLDLDATTLLDQIFGDFWRGKYVIGFCQQCDAINIKCPECSNASCTGGGCEKCNSDFDDFIKTRNSPESYLTEEENRAILKQRRLKRFITESLKAGFEEINWEYIGTHGFSSQRDEELFPQLSEFKYNPELTK